MTIRIIRNLLLIAVLAISLKGNSQPAEAFVSLDETVLNIPEQEDIRVPDAQKFHIPSEEFQVYDFTHLNAPVQESSMSVRRIETSRSEESADCADSAIPVEISLVCAARKSVANNSHCNSALCHNSRFYIYKFGSIRI